MPEPSGEQPAAVRWTSPDHPLWTWLLAIGTLATVLPLWASPRLPFADLPEHAAQIAILRHWFDPVWRPGELFSLDLGRTQYLLYYLVGAVLAVPLGSAERANLVLLSAIAVATPWTLRALFRALRLDARAALFALPLFWNQSLLFGLVNYLAALPLCFAGLAWVAADAESPSLRRRIGLSILGVALYFLHLSALLFFLPAAAWLTWVLSAPSSSRALPGRLGGLAVRLGWVVPVGALCVLWLVTSPVLRPGDVGFQTAMETRFFPLLDGVRRLPHALTDIWKTPVDRYLLNTLLAVAAVLAIPSRRAPADAGPRWPRLALGGAFAIALLLYFLMPHSVGWLWLLNDRYAIVAAMLGPALLPGRDSVRAAACFLAAFVLGLTAAFDSGRLIRRCSEESSGIDEVLAAAEPRRKLLGLLYDDESAWIRYSPYHHLHALYRARTGGIAEHSFLDLPQSPVRYRPEHQPPRRPYGWEWKPDQFRNGEHGKYFDYLLVRGEPPSFAPDGPRWSEVARSGGWRLYGKAQR